MESLKHEIMSLRVRNPEFRYFIPHWSFYQLMSKKRIKEVLLTINTAAYSLEELITCILEGARRIFGILVLIQQPEYISSFIKNGPFQYQIAQLDHKIPFHYAQLETILPKKIASEFYERQWEMAAPVFAKGTLPRLLEDETILPFLEDQGIGEGGFGMIYKTRLHASHHKFENLAGHTFIRKQFISRATDKVDYELELRNLSALNHLKHPNILELLSAYSHRGLHILIFPFAQGGDLAEFLQADRPAEFESNETFIIALSNLASAIENVHNFTSQKLELKFIGCHHDLKPRNILVNGSTMLLADFGLSRLKSESQSSKTNFKSRSGDYIAPECEDLDDEAQTHPIHRSSDIWSFGCIIAEIMTYMALGPAGVSKFRQKREYKCEGYKFYRFHHGPNQPSGDVVTWLHDLEGLSDKSTSQLVQLVNRMLSIDPAQRPKAAEVMARLRHIILNGRVRLIHRLFDKISLPSHAIEAHIEGVRFGCWMSTCGFPSTEEGKTPSLSYMYHIAYKPVLDLLAEIRDELERTEIGTAEEDTSNRVSFPLRRLNNELRDLLPLALQKKLQSQLEYTLIDSQDLEVLSKTRRAFTNQFSKNKVGMLAAVKCMRILALEHTQLRKSDLEINPELIEYRGKLESCDIGILRDTHSSQVHPTLIEWMRYENPLVTEQMGREKLVRIEAIAELLHSDDKPDEFRTLQCSGFFHRPEACCFGLLFDFPLTPADGSHANDKIASSQLLQPVTLHQILEDLELRKQLPDLGDRFKLAHVLATSIAELHKVGWLHKNLTSSNIVYFPLSRATLIDYATQPYLIGFNHSRPDEPSSFTSYLSSEGYNHKDYQHPTYLRNQSRYCPQFDYYSLGMVLLEIGLWKPLSNILNRGQGSPENFRASLLEKRVPKLKQLMGARYYRIVDTCLRGTLDLSPTSGNTDTDGIALHMAFEELVIKPLSQCSV